MILLALEVYLALVVSKLHYNNLRLLCSLNSSNLVIYLWKSGIRTLRCIFKAGIGWDWLEIFEACCWRMFQILVKNLWGKYAYVCKNMYEPSAKLSSCIIQYEFHQLLSSVRRTVVIMEALKMKELNASITFYDFHAHRLIKNLNVTSVKRISKKISHLIRLQFSLCYNGNLISSAASDLLCIKSSFKG